MLVTNHVLAGALLGAALRRPAPAFLLGVASHFAMDSVPHWGGFGEEVFEVVAPVDGILGLTVMGAASVMAGGDRVAVLAGMVGAALPDLDKPGRWFFGHSPFPAAVDAWHSQIQRYESPRLHVVEVGAALVLGTLGVRAMRRLRRERAEGSAL